MTAPLLHLDGVSRTHGTGDLAVAALVDFDLVVQPGEMVAVMGPSGSGKSTLLTLAGGLDRPSAGRVLIDGQDLGGLGATQIAAIRRRDVGYVFQQLNLIPALTAAENVSLPLELDGTSARTARGQAADMLERVGLADKADRFPDDLSGGEQQRVAIARAMVGRRRLILADEPTGALDHLTGERVMRHLSDHCRNGGAVVMVTHDATMAGWADRILHLRDGRIDLSVGIDDPSVLLAGAR